MGKRYHELSRKQLLKRLQRKKNLPPSIRALIVDRAQDKRRALIRQKRIGNNLTRAWEMFIAPLKMEMNRASVRRAAAKKENNETRLEFYDAYTKLLNKTLGILRLKQKMGGKYPAHYGHATWIDWIPAKVQDAFREHHATIYTNFKARTPSPLFQFTDPEVKRNALKAEILAGWVDDIRTAETRLEEAIAANDKDEAKHQRYRKFILEKASTRLKYLPANKRLYRDWQNYLTEDEKYRLDVLEAGI